jgi:hypothetical protein
VGVEKCMKKKKKERRGEEITTHESHTYHD